MTKHEKTSQSVLLVEHNEGKCQTNNLMVGEEYIAGSKTDRVLTVCMTVQDHHDGWFLDSGATAHICQKAKYFSEYKPARANQKVSLGDNRQLQVKGVGSVRFNLPRGQSFELKDVLHVPEISKNLVSVSQLVKDGRHQIRFMKNSC